MGRISRRYDLFCILILLLVSGSTFYIVGEAWGHILFTMVWLIAVMLIVQNNRLVTVTKKQEDIILQLRYWSERDALTGLKNRNGLSIVANEIEVRSTGATVIVCDIDGLKWINDTLGHLVGDEVICGAAKKLKLCSPQNASLFRMGGDEFLILIPEILTTNQQQSMREAILHECTKEKHLRLSVGMACMEIGEDNLREIIRRADCNMYKDRKSKSQVYSHLESSREERT